jgi:hypothetical protein
MDATGRIARRAVLRAGAASALLAAVVPGHAATARAAGPAGVVAERLRTLLKRPASAARLGAAYLSLTPQEADEAVLVARLASRWPGGVPALAAASDAELAGCVASACRADFAEGDTVILDGWILSRAELRLSALHAVTVA